MENESRRSFLLKTLAAGCFTLLANPVRELFGFEKRRNRLPGWRELIDYARWCPSVHTIPVSDKNNYVRKYSMDERCVGGTIPAKGVMIDKSSGSSGTAMNWIRGNSERTVNARYIRFGLRNLFGKEPLFIINAFALGPWATGMNISMSCLPFSY